MNTEPLPAKGPNSQGPGREFQCSKCPSSYSRRDDLRKHERVKHGIMLRPAATKGAFKGIVPDDGSRFACEVPGCGRSYKTLPTLRAHEREGHGLYQKEKGGKHSALGLRRAVPNGSVPLPEVTVAPASGGLRQALDLIQDELDKLAAVKKFLEEVLENRR